MTSDIVKISMTSLGLEISHPTSMTFQVFHDHMNPGSKCPLPNLITFRDDNNVVNDDDCLLPNLMS